MRFDRMSRGRKAIGMAIVVCRLAVCVSVGCAGCICLSGEFIFSEMLLNAAALAVIMEVGEIIFETLAPDIAGAILEKLEPLSLATFTESTAS